MEEKHEINSLESILKVIEILALTLEDHYLKIEQLEQRISTFEERLPQDK